MKTIFFTITTILALNATATFAEQTNQQSTEGPNVEHNHKDHKHDHAKVKSSSSDDSNDFDTKKIAGTQSSKVTVKVHGMVCSFCATGVKKGFSKLKAIKSVDVDLDQMLVKLELNKENILSIDVIKATIEKSGYEFKGAKYE